MEWKAPTMDTDNTGAYMDTVRAVLRAHGLGTGEGLLDEAELIQFAEQRGWSVQVHQINSTWTATIRAGGPHSDAPLAIAEDHRSHEEALADAVAMALQEGPWPPQVHAP